MKHAIRRALLFAMALMLFAAAAAAEAPQPRATFSPGGGGGRLELPAKQDEFFEGMRTVRAGDALYAIELDGVYRFDGARRSLIARGAFDLNGSIVTDGETVYVTSTDEYGAMLLRIEGGDVYEVATLEPAAFVRIAGVIDDKVYLLFVDPEDDWSGLHVVEANLETGEQHLLLSHIGGTQLWWNNLIASGFRTDVGPSAHVIVGRDGEVATISESALYAAGKGDGIYYWACDGDEENGIIWSWMELRHIGADGVESLLNVKSPGGSAWPGESFDTFSTFYYMVDEDGEMIEYVVDHETLEVTEIALPGGGFGIWFEDGGEVYCYSYETGVLYRTGERGFEEFVPLLDLADASVYDVFNGYVYCADWDVDAPIRAERLGSI